MEPFARQQFDLVLADAAAGLVERAVHRCGGPQPALDRLRDDPDGDGVWLDRFAAAYLDENLLTGPAAAAHVLEALAARPLPPDPGGPAAEVLDRLARAAFADAVRQQAMQQLNRALVFS